MNVVHHARQFRHSEESAQAWADNVAIPSPSRHCEERSDEAIFGRGWLAPAVRLLRFARNDRFFHARQFRHCEESAQAWADNVAIPSPSRHCEERSDEAIFGRGWLALAVRLLRFARNNRFSRRPHRGDPPSPGRARNLAAKLSVMVCWALFAILGAYPALAQAQPPVGKAWVTNVNVVSGDRPAEPGYEWGTQLSVSLQATVNTYNQPLALDATYGFAVNNPANNSPFPRLVAEFTGPDVSGGSRWRGWLNQFDVPPPPNPPTYVERCAVTSDVAGNASDYVAFSSTRDNPNGEIYYMAEWPSGTVRRVTNRPGLVNVEPALSPDAARIAFASYLPGGPGDIFTILPDGSGLTNLTNSAADDRNPAWSPDGSKIAFASVQAGSYQLWMMNRDGTNPQPLATLGAAGPGTQWPEPAWDPNPSDNGRHVAFASVTASGDYDVWVLDITGADPTPLWNVTNSAAGNDYSPTWSPDGNHLAFVSDRDGDEEIYRIDVDLVGQTSSGTINLTNSPSADDAHPKWGEDTAGQFVLFESPATGDADIYILDPATPGSATSVPSLSQTGSWDGEVDFATLVPRLLTLTWPASGAYTLRPYQGPDGKWGAYNISERADNRFGAVGEWSLTRLSLRLILANGQDWLDYNGDPAAGLPVGKPAAVSGSRIAFEAWRDIDPATGLPQAEVYIVDADGRNQKRLTFNPAADTNPSLSPNGRQIAFVSNRDGNNEIYVMNADGTSQRNVTNNAADDVEPCWSPDGQWIAFSSKRSGSYEIWVMNADGSNPIPITTLGNDSRSPTWSPDGAWLAFSSNADGDFDIYRMPAPPYGGADQNLTQANDSTSAQDTAPSWSPDGTKIAFVSERVAPAAIFTMGSDGVSAPTQLTTPVSAADGAPSWSPRGDQIAFQRDTGTGYDIWTMTSTGLNPAVLVASTAADVNPSWNSTTGYCFDINNPLALTQWNGTSSVWQAITDPTFYLPYPVSYAVANLAVNGNVTILPDLNVPLSPHGATESIGSTVSVGNRSFVPFTPSSDNAAGFAATADVGLLKVQPPRGFEPLPPSTSPQFPPIPGSALDMTLLAGTSRIDLVREGASLDVAGNLAANPGGLGVSVTPPENQPPAADGYATANPRYTYWPSIPGTLPYSLTWSTKNLPSPPEAAGSTVPLSEIMPYLAYFYVDVNHNGRLDRAGQTRIAFASGLDVNSEIYAMNSDASNLTRLTNNSAYDTTPSWSPDGTKIAFCSGRDGNREIYVMNSGGSNQVNLTNNAADDMQARWSPGNRILFVSNRDFNEEIYVMNSDGSSQTNLTNNAANDLNPCWSPDGSRIAFVSNRGGNNDIWVMNSDGTNPINLTNNPADDASPCWSPDGSKIAFDSGDGVTIEEIYVMNSDGTGRTQVTHDSMLDWWPSWSPDGSKIAFESNRDGSNEVYVINADGTNETRITINPPNQLPSWSPVPGGLGALFEEPYRGFEVTAGVPTDHRVRIAEESIDLGKVRPGEAYVPGISGVGTPYGLASYSRNVSLTLENVGNVDLGALDAVITPLTSSDTPNVVNTRLGAVLGAGDASMTVEDATRFPDKGLVLIDAEEIAYSSRTATTLDGLTGGRGMKGTTAAAHAQYAVVSCSDAPNVVNTRLAVALGAGDASMTVDDATAFPNAGLVLIDDEEIAYSSHTNTTLDGLTRGMKGTLPAAHALAAVVSWFSAPPGALQAQVLQTWVRPSPQDNTAGQPMAMRSKFTEETSPQRGTYDAAGAVFSARISIFVPPDQPAGTYRGSLWVTASGVRITDKPIDVELTVTEANAAGANSRYADITPALFRYYNPPATGKQELSLLWASNRNDIALGGSGFNFDIWAAIAPWDNTTDPLRPLFAPGAATLFVGNPLNPAAVGNFATLEPYVSDPVDIPGGDSDGWYLTYYQNLYPSFAYDMNGNPWIFWQLNTWWQHRINVGSASEAVDAQQFRCYLGQAWWDGSAYQIGYLTQNTGGAPPTIYHEQPLTFSETTGTNTSNVWSFWNNGLETDRWLYFNYYQYTAGVGFSPLAPEDKPLRPMAKYDWTAAGPTPPARTEVGCALNYATDPAVFGDNNPADPPDPSDPTDPRKLWGVVFSGFSTLGRNEDLYYMRLRASALRQAYPGPYDPSQIWDAGVSGRVPFETQDELMQPLASSAVKDSSGNTHYKGYRSIHPDWLVNAGAVLQATIYRKRPADAVRVDVTGGAGFTGAANGDFTFTDAVTGTVITVDPAAGTVTFENATDTTLLPASVDEVSAVYTPLVKRLTTDKANDNSPIVTVDRLPVPEPGNGSRRRLSLFWRRSVPGELPSLHYKTFSFDSSPVSPTYTQWVRDSGAVSPFYHDSEGIIPISGLTDESQIFAFPNWDSTGTYCDRWWLLWTSTHGKTQATFEPFSGTFVLPYASDWDIHYMTLWPNSQPEVTIPSP